MLFALIFGLGLGGGAAYLQYGQTEPQIDAAISVGVIVALFVVGRVIGGWGLLLGLGAIVGGGLVLLGGPPTDNIEQTIWIYQRIIELGPERWLDAFEDVSRIISRNDLQGEIPADALLMFWGVEAFFAVAAALAGASAGKRARARSAAETVGGGRQTRRTASPKQRAPAKASTAGSPWGGAPAAASAVSRSAKGSEPERRAHVSSESPVRPVETPTIVDMSKRGRWGDYVN